MQLKIILPVSKSFLKQRHARTCNIYNILSIIDNGNKPKRWRIQEKRIIST